MIRVYAGTDPVKRKDLYLVESTTGESQVEKIKTRPQAQVDRQRSAATRAALSHVIEACPGPGKGVNRAQRWVPARLGRGRLGETGQAEAPAVLPRRPPHLRGTQGHQGRVLRARLSRHARYAPKEWIVTTPLLLTFLNWSR